MAINFETATADELQGWMDQQDWSEAEPGLKDKLTGVILARRTKEQVQFALREEKRKTLGKELDAKAEQAFPELLDKESELYKRVAAEMESREDELGNPYLYSDVAYRIGAQLGLSPAGSQPRKPRSDEMDDIGAGEGAGEPESKNIGEDFLEKTKDIAAAFEGIIDMSDPDTRARIAKRAEEASDNG